MSTRHIKKELAKEIDDLAIKRTCEEKRLFKSGDILEDIIILGIEVYKEKHKSKDS